MCRLAFPLRNERYQMNTSSFSRSLKICADQIVRNVQALTGGTTLEIENLKSLFPLPVPLFGQAQTVSFLEALFQPAERIHVMWRRQKGVGGKWSNPLMAQAERNAAGNDLQP